METVEVGAVLCAVFPGSSWAGRVFRPFRRPLAGRPGRVRFLIMKLMASGGNRWAAISKSPSFFTVFGIGDDDHLPALMSARISGDGGDVGHGISFLADGGGAWQSWYGLDPATCPGILAACSIFGLFSPKDLFFSRADSSPWLMAMAWANLVCWPLWCCVIHCRRLWQRRSVVFMMG